MNARLTDACYQIPEPDTASTCAEAVEGPGVLGNMSARPRTPVTCTVQPLRRTWATFAFPERFRLDESTRRRLDISWAQIGFTGAALVQLGGELPGGVRVYRCADTDLAVNVVLRTRGSLLLAEMCLLDDVDGFAGVTVTSGDPRLVTWVGGVL